jgi:hypothetical protein
MYKKLLFSLFIALSISSIVGAKIYLWEDFEGFTPGESLDTTGVWVQQGSAPLGIASDVLSYPSGGISGYFEKMAGIRLVISEGELPTEFVISTWRTPGSFILFANVWADSGYAYLDSIGIADTLEEIGQSNEIALNPSPADGALIEGTWANLGWSPGDYVVSHDIYISDNVDADVI